MWSYDSRCFCPPKVSQTDTGVYCNDQAENDDQNVSSGEWLKYTVYTSESELFNVTARYATMGTSTALSISVDDGTDDACDNALDSTVLYSTKLPSTGGWDVWVDTSPVRRMAEFDHIKE